MKTYKSGISLIVLIITVLVLSILATVAIVSLSETNIIGKTNAAVFKSDMANYKEMYQLYLTEQLLENSRFNSSTLNVKYSSNGALFTDIFGNNVKEEYKDKLQVEQGKLVYKSMDEEEVEILQQLGMAVTITSVDDIEIGDLVEYTPTASATGSYTGATYVKDTDSTSDTYNTYIESTANYTPGSMKWVYLGKDENGNTLLTSQEATSFTMTIGGQDGWVTGPDRIDALCSTLYGNTTYALETRNMKIEDVNRVLGYNGPKGTYYDADYERVTTDNAMTFGDIEELEGATVSRRETPRLSQTEFEDYLSDYYYYAVTTYKAATTDEYKVIFKKADGTSDQPAYWLSSTAAFVDICDDYAEFGVWSVFEHELTYYYFFVSYGNEGAPSSALRPIIVLKSNIHFGEKNSNGEWKLVEM